jgi:hypothetical protein
MSLRPRTGAGCGGTRDAAAAAELGRDRRGASKFVKRREEKETVDDCDDEEEGDGRGRKLDKAWWAKA